MFLVRLTFAHHQRRSAVRQRRLVHALFRRHGSIRGLSSAALRQQLANGGNQIDRDFHHRVRRGLVRGFVLGDGFLVGLVFVVSKDSLHSRLVPTSWILRLLHDFFRLRRSAFKAFGPRSYAVTNES